MLFQSNVLEASPDMKRESEKEWYFGNADKERRGPFGFEEVSVHSAAGACAGEPALTSSSVCSDAGVLERRDADG